MSISTNRRLVAVACLALTLTACSADEHTEPTSSQQPPIAASHVPSPVIVTAVTPAEPAPSIESSPNLVESSDLNASFDSLAATLPAGQVGVALFNGQQVTRYGTWTKGAAWSTIKVPLSIAALRLDATSAEAAMQLAISQSDNAAADQMWNMLGHPAAAAAAVDNVLRDGGDASTRVQSQQVNPPYSPFGQTDWPIDQAAIFAFGLPCIAGAAPVLDQMRNLGGNQQWGLAPFADAAKGGWGPEAGDGGYLIRQIALVANGTGTIGVSLAADPADGSFETGKAMLNYVGSWINQRRNMITGGQC